VIHTNFNQNILLKYRFWNIGIGDQSNKGNWPNIGETFLKISVSVWKKWYWFVSSS